MRRRKAGFVLVAVVVLSLVAGGCGPAAELTPSPEAPTPTTAPGAPTPTPTAEVETPEEEVVLRIAQVQEVHNWDPALMHTADMGPIMDNVYEGLVALEKDTAKLVPWLAEDWEFSADGKSLIFKLREGVKFHDGTEFDADAAKFSFDRVKTINKGPAPFIEGISEAEVVDKYTLKLSIEEYPRLALKGMVLIMMVSPAVKEHEVDGDLGQAWLQSHSAGTGPYILTEVKPGERQVYERFDDYWRGWEEGQAHRVEFIVQEDQSVARLMLERGDIDMTLLYSPDHIQPLQDNPDVKVHLSDLKGHVQTITLNTKLEPLDDVRVRQAIAHAWNREAWREVNEGYVSDFYAPAPVELLCDDYEPIVYEYDLERAKELLTDAGYPDGGFSLTFYHVDGDDYRKSMGELLGEELRKLGIELKMQALNAPTIFAMIEEFGKTQDPASSLTMFPLFAQARIVDAHNYLDWMYNSEAWEWGRNFMYYDNPEVDRLLAEAAAQVDEEEAKEIYCQIADIVMEDCPVLIIELMQGRMYMRENIEGFYFIMELNQAVPFYDIRKW